MGFLNRLRGRFRNKGRRHYPGVTFGSGVLLRGEDRFFPGAGLFIDHYAYVNCGGADWCGDRGYFRTGKNCEIGPYSVIWCAGGVEFGDNVHLGSHVVISAHTSIQVPPWENDPDTKLQTQFAPVVVESHVLIGPGSAILPGVRIGHHALIGAGSTVTCDIAPYSVAVGNPARVVHSSQLPAEEEKVT